MASHHSAASQGPLSLQQAQSALQSRLISLYSQREAANITDWVLENITGKKKIDRILYKSSLLTPKESLLFEKYATDLEAGRPVQYVLHESWFDGLRFYVDESVLIPRPETEELVDWVAAEAAASPDNSGPILDVGTGSGCIALSLKHRLPGALVLACDCSEKALSVARRNAADLSIAVDFQTLDFLDIDQRVHLPPTLLLVSNPPYIPLRDKASMAPRVTDHEPHMALFVKDEDPLVFYKALALHGRSHLLPGGAIYAEIHEELATPVADLFRQTGYEQVFIKKDMQGKERMIKATT